MEDPGILLNRQVRRLIRFAFFVRRKPRKTSARPSAERLSGSHDQPDSASTGSFVS